MTPGYPRVMPTDDAVPDEEPEEALERNEFDAVIRDALAAGKPPDDDEEPAPRTSP